MRETKRITYVALACALLGAPPPCAGQPAEATARALAAFHALEGSWEGTGELFGRPAAFSMTWDPRGGGVWVLDFSNAMVGEDGSTTPVLDATAIYRVQADSIRGVWIDSRPERIELSSVADATTVTTLWRSDSECGRTVYRVLPDGSVEVEDHVRTDDGWRLFGQAVYRRSPEP